MSEFALTIRLENSASGIPRISLANVTGTSQGTSAAGTTLIVLGTVTDIERAARLAERYDAGGAGAIANDAGEYGALVLERSASEAKVVAPRMGIRQVFWATTNGSLRLASRPQDLLSGQHRSVRPDAVYHYVYFNVLPGPMSVFDGISKLEPGHVLRWHGSAATATRDWQPVFSEEADRTEKHAAAELFRLLRAAVSSTLEPYPSAGAFLSGGLDSSTVAGLAAEQRPGLPTVTMGFDAAGYDETEFARMASGQFQTRALEYYVTPDDVLATLPRIAGAFSEPFGNSSAAAVFHCARIGREAGVDLLLAGDGGDELFGGNERYAKQLVFEHYGRMPAVFRRGALEPFLRGAGKVTKGFPIGKALSYIEQAAVPLPDRLQSYNFLHRHDPGEVFTPALLGAVDAGAPLQALRREYSAPQSCSAVNRMLFLDWKFTLHDNDLVKVNTMCDLAGMNVAYPMLDPAVVDFSMRLPTSWKVHRGELRWFYKRAMTGFLPQQIIKKTKHGFGLPFGVWTAEHAGLKKLAAESLACLSTRGFFQPKFLRDSLRMHQDVHAKYYGELVWILMVLELWLQVHAPEARL